MMNLFKSTLIILFTSFLSVSASAEEHKITSQTIITKEQFLSLIDGQTNTRLTKEIEILNDRVEELASAETFIKKQNDDLMAALEGLTNELVRLKDEKAVNQLNTNDYQNMIAEEIQSLKNNVAVLSSSEALVRSQNRRIIAELAALQIDLKRLTDKNSVNNAGSVDKISSISSQIQTLNSKVAEMAQSEELFREKNKQITSELAAVRSELKRLASEQLESQTRISSENFSGKVANDYQISDDLITTSSNNDILKQSSSIGFRGLLAYFGVNHSSSTTSYKWSSGGDNLELDGVGRQSINASFGFEYNLVLGRTTRLLLGFEFNPTSEDFVEISGTQSGNPGDFKATLKNRQTYYAGLGFVPAENTMIYGKLSYDQGDAELKTNPVLQNQNVQFKGFGYGAGLRTLLSENIFLGTEVMRINYEKESLLGVNTGTGTTNGKVQLGAYF